MSVHHIALPFLELPGKGHYADRKRSLANQILGLRHAAVELTMQRFLFLLLSGKESRASIQLIRRQYIGKADEMFLCATDVQSARDLCNDQFSVSLLTQLALRCDDRFRLNQ